MLNPASIRFVHECDDFQVRIGTTSGVGITAFSLDEEHLRDLYARIGAELQSIDRDAEVARSGDAGTVAV